MTRAVEQIEHILVHLNNGQLFISENMTPDGMVALPWRWCDPIYDFL